MREGWKCSVSSASDAMQDTLVRFARGFNGLDLINCDLKLERREPPYSLR
jgi:hypothetical protein